MRALDRIMQERISYGGALFTRKGLLKKLQEYGYSEKFIDWWVFRTPLVFEEQIQPLYDQGYLLNTEPNKPPKGFWEDDEKSLDCVIKVKGA